MSAVLSERPALELAFLRMRDSDLEAVAAIEKSVYVFPWTIGNFRDSLLSAYECWACWTNGELIAYAIVMAALDEAHLLNFAVANKWQRQGVGATFLQHLIDHSRDANREMFYLEVRPSNVAGLWMYQRFGFKQLGIRREYYPAVTGREDAYFMGLNIAKRII